MLVIDKPESLLLLSLSWHLHSPTYGQWRALAQRRDNYQLCIAYADQPQDAIDSVLRQLAELPARPTAPTLPGLVGIKINLLKRRTE